MNYSVFLSRFLEKKILFWIFVLVGIAASVGKYLQGTKLNGYTDFNNYVIFKQSFFHLFRHQDLYILYLNEQWDLYKYSPTFSLAMGVLVWLPDVLGLIFFNLANALLLFYAICKMPFLGEKNKSFILWFLLLELLTNIQNTQTNALMAGLIILAFNQLENKKVWLATLFIVLSVYIKLFGMVAFALFFFYPDKKKFIASSAVWLLLVGFLPALFISPSELLWQYQNWQKMLVADHDFSYGVSVMGWLKACFDIDFGKNVTVFCGIILFCLPLLKIKNYAQFQFRLLFLCSILLWTVIFNHRAESPSFIIAVTAIAIWYFSQPSTRFHFFLLLLTFVLTSLFTTDLLSRSFKEAYYYRYLLKVVPCIFIWLKILYEMWRLPAAPAVELVP